MATPIETVALQKFGVDYEKKVEQILPFFWSFTINTLIEKAVFRNFVFALFSQFKLLNTQLVDFASFINTRLNFTGQVLALTTLLNDNFDDPLRRITITCFNSPFVEGLDVFLDSETDPTPMMLFLDVETNDIPITLFLDSEINDPTSLAGKAFEVNVPNGVVESDIIIRVLLDIYVVAPQEFLIKRIPV